MLGTKIVAGTRRFIAAYATAAPWLPPDAATTPAGGTSRSSRFANAPRVLNDPACCNSSSFANSAMLESRPASAGSSARSGVRRTYGAISRAVSAIASRSPFESLRVTLGLAIAFGRRVTFGLVVASGSVVGIALDMIRTN
jgi:hypothetical protein